MKTSDGKVEGWVVSALVCRSEE